MDKAGKKYWDDSWSTGSIPDSALVKGPGLVNYINRSFNNYFCKIFSSTETRGMKLLELGCARSVWLPYFAKEFGFKVHGLDYSEIGCGQAVQILKNEGVEGRVVCADFFFPPHEMLRDFDVVVSFGVAEHFQDSEECISAFAKFLKPGGIIITSIPNMVGITGTIEKLINRPVYDVHKPIDAELLLKAHESSGLEVLGCEYFISTNFGILNLQGIRQKSIEWFAKKILVSVLARFSLFVWWVESVTGPLGACRCLSPYINCLARKPVD